MKLKEHAVFAAAAALANVATAQDGVYGASVGTGRNRSLDPSQGIEVAPGQVVKSKRQRQREEQQKKENRTDSAITSLDGQVEDHADAELDHTSKCESTRRDAVLEWYETQHDLEAFKAKVRKHAPVLKARAARVLEPVDLDLKLESMRSVYSSTAVTQEPFRTIYHYDRRAVILLTIAFLLVFGALYTLFEYLPSFPRASACSVTTVYVPITYTITSGMSASNSTTPDITYTSTTTHTSMVTETFTVTAASSDPVESTSAAVDPTTGAPSYAYTVNSAGSTSWVNGISPSSGASLATITSTIVMQPVPQDKTAAAIQSTSTVLQKETVTPPAYTSTVYSFVSPDLTSTSTSTHYITYTLSEVSPAASITTTRTSFSGISSGGWNASSSTSSAGSEETSGPVSTTILVTSYFGSGTRTTSTTTELIRTTVALTYTTTISQVIESSLSNGQVTTITTVLPATIVPGTNGPILSTSVTAPEPVSSSSSGATVNPAGLTTRPVSIMSSSNVTSSSGLVAYSQSAATRSINTSSTPSGSASAGSRTSGNITIVTNTQSSRATSSNPTASVASPDSITHTISAAALSGTSAVSTMPNVSNPSIASISSSTISQVQTTSVASSISASGSPNFSANSTNSAKPNVRPSPSSSGLSAGSLTTGGSSSRSNSPSSSPSSSFGHPSANLTTSSIPYGYGGSAASPQGTAVSVSVANSFTSHSGPRPSIPAPSVPTRSPPPLTSSSSSPSTLATSTRSISGQTSKTPAEVSPTSVISTPFSLATVNNTSSSRSIQTSHPHSPSQATTAAARSSHESSSGRFTIQTSMPSSVSDATTANATNPFPASSATATPSAGCGEQGDFVVDFDDLPRFLPSGNQTQPDITQAPPVPNPYHHLTFSDGYVYAPEPSEPYQPSSPPHLAVFLANATGKTASPFGTLVKPGEVGDGTRDSISAFWFDAKSAYFGCDNPGPAACRLLLSAYTWSASANAELLTYAQNVTIPACPDLTGMDCKLTKVEFPQAFKSLTGLQVQAFTGKDQRMFFMDDLNLSWSNTSCAAGLLRQSSL